MLVEQIASGLWRNYLVLSTAKAWRVKGKQAAKCELKSFKTQMKG